MRSLRALWEFLIAVPAPAAAVERRHQSALLAKVLLALVSLGSLSLVLQWLAVPGFGTTLLAVLPGVALLLGAYVINRHGHYPLAAAITVIATALAALAVMAVNPEDDFAFAYLGVSLVLAALLLTPARLLGFVAAVLAALLGVSLVALNRTPVDVVTGLLFVATVGCLLWIMLRHREGIERDRRAQLEEREALLSKAQEVAHVGSFSWDLTSDRVHWSRESYRLFGADPDRAGTDIWQILQERLHPDDQPTLAAAIARIRNAGGYSPMELRARWPDGTTHTLWTEGDLIRDATGRPVRMVGTLQDISERKRAEAALAQSEANFRSLTESANVAILVNHRGRHVFANPRALALLGYTREEICQTGVKELVHPDEYDKVMSRFRARMASEDVPAVYETVFVAKDGRLLPVELTATRTRWEGEPAGLVFLHDIGARKQIERALHESEQRFRALIEGSADAVVLLTPEGRISYESPTVARILHTPPGSLVRRYAHEFIHPDDRAGVAAALVEVSQTVGATLTHQARMRHHDGDWRVLECVFTNMLAVPGVHAIVNNFRDITDRVAVETALRESEMRLSEAQAIAQLGSWELDLVTQALHWSDEIYRIFELDPQRFASSYAAFLARVHPDDRATVDRAYTESVANRHSYSITHRLLMPDGRIKHVHEQGQTYYDDAGKPLRSVGTVQDVTARKQAEARMQQLSRAVEQTADSIVITDKRGAIEYVNQAFEQITGYSASEALGQTPRLVKSGVHDAEFYRRLWATIERGEVFRDVLVNRRRNGELYFEEKTITPLRDEAGEITHYISTGKDITERMQVQERLQYLAHHDALTELPNRVLFMDRLTHALTRAQWHERVVAVLFLDLDRFKYINDTFGHNVGDKFLQHMAARLKSCVREGDTVARLGGDEFALLLEDVGQVADIAPVADKLLAALAAPFVLEGREFFVTTSIGISLYPADGVDGQTLLKHADTAMYRAKDLGRNNYQFYSADLSAKAFERLTLETSLRRALERDEFLLYYQPQVDIKSQRLIGVEVLIRWRHPELGVVSPTQFIPLAEETGLIVPIGEWVLRSACTQARAWRAAGLGFGSITVNISGRQFADPALAARIGQVLSDTKLDAGLLELEITESVVMHDPQSAVHTLEQLNAMGVRIAIDDFGTGYSSLAYLKRYPIDTLKVDQSFVRDVTHDPNDASIVQAIIAMARSMQLRVIAEGVETEEQLTFLRTHGCEAVQGYLFSRPVPAEEARELIARGRFSSMPARAR